MEEEDEKGKSLYEGFYLALLAIIISLEILRPILMTLKMEIEQWERKQNGVTLLKNAFNDIVIYKTLDLVS